MLNFRRELTGEFKISGRTQENSKTAREWRENRKSIKRESQILNSLADQIDDKYLVEPCNEVQNQQVIGDFGENLVF